MGRRRRLALRQLDEDEVDDRALEIENNAAAETDLPSFELLPPAAPSPPKASPPQQHKSPVKTSTCHVENASIFHIYQEGMTPDQMLQLSFMRRKPRLPDPKLHSSLLEQQFIAPAPHLPATSIIPSMDIQLIHDLIHQKPIEAHPKSYFDINYEEIKRKMQTESELTPAEAAACSAFSDNDWRHVLSSQARPSLQVLCSLLRQCGHSQALVKVLWNELLPHVLIHETSQEKAGIEALLRLLVSQPWIQTMAPSEFRARVRAYDLRNRIKCEDEAAWIEWELMKSYREARINKNTKLQR